MAKNDTKSLASQIIELVGGRDNISALTHCISRLRFNLKDEGLVDKEKLENLSEVKGLKFQNGQIQVIIGQKVNLVYDEAVKLAGIQAGTAGDAQDTPKEKMTAKLFFSRLIDAISGSITPNIPILLAAGMLKVVNLLAGSSGLSLLTEESATYQILSLVADAGFYFLPIFIAASAARKFNTNQGLAMFLMAALLHPAFIELVGSGVSLSVFGIPITSASYSSTVLPAIMIVWVMKYVYKFISKISPEIIASVLVPFGTVLIMIPISFCILGPLGVIMGNYVTSFFIWLYNTTGAFGVGIMGAVYPFLVITGMHATLAPALVQMLSDLGYEPFLIWANICANLAIGASALALGIRAKNKNTKSGAIASSVSAIIGGVTEPALFGYVLRYRSLFIGILTGGFAGAFYGGIMKVYTYVMPGSGGLFAIPSFIGNEGGGVVHAIIGLCISMVVAFIVTLFVKFKEDDLEKA